MKFTLTLLCGFLFLQLQAQDGYKATVDLTKVKKDRLKVILYTPAVKEATAVYVIPKVIPGSYSTKDFGRFVNRFTAYSKSGKKLKTEKLDVNRYKIFKADQLGRVEYEIDDTWDAEDNNFIFQPGGTQIDDGRSFVINHQGFWGYIENYKMLPYEIEVQKPKGFFAATALDVNRGTEKDVLKAESYVKLVDNPVLYSLPDTSSFLVGNTRVHVAVVSETNKVNSILIADILKPLAVGLDSFFGGMPVDNYHFLMYFPNPSNPEITGKGGYGALEHSYSSLYFLPELSNFERLKGMVLSVSAHEFLHILTPLNIHSEEIEYFDFIEPKMSQHLWMYEGVTEYFSMLLQWKSGLISEEEFFEEVRDKILTASEYQDVSFTEMSRNILNPEYKDSYQNVYYKGALIGLLLDIRLRELSGGEKGLVHLMQALAASYGPSRPFKDGELIGQIVEGTYPEIGDFFNRYVVGSEPLPLDEYLKKIGYRYFPVRLDSLTTFGNISMDVDPEKNQLIVVDTPKGENVFGLENDDVITMINGQQVNASNFQQALEPVLRPDGNTVTLVIQRGEEMYQIESEPVTIPVELEFVLEPNPSVESKQLNLRESLVH